MKKKLEFTEYTKNMYFGETSKFWTYFNIKRNQIILKKIISNLKKKDIILEIGAYDAYFANELLKKSKIKPKKYILSDIFDQRELQKKINTI